MLKAILIQLGILLGIALCALGVDLSEKNISRERNVASDANLPPAALLKDFNYSLSNIPDLETGQKIYDSLESTSLEKNFALQCGNRAHVWSWQMKKNFNVDSGKIFLYYTPKSFNHTGMLWGVHVVPYVVINGQEYVIEKIREYALGRNGYFLKDHLLFSGPVPLNDWLHKLTGFSSCRELSILEPNDHKVLKLFKKVKSIKTSDNCIIQKAPMEYVWPISVHSKTFKGISPPSISRSSALEACSYTLKADSPSEQTTRCNELL